MGVGEFRAPFVVDAEGMQHFVIGMRWFADDAELDVHALDSLGVAAQVFVGSEADVEEDRFGVVGWG